MDIDKNMNVEEIIKISPEDLKLSDDELYSKLMKKICFSYNISHVGILQDQITRKINLARKRTICERCSGTGNEIYSMFKKCQECNGKGYKK